MIPFKKEELEELVENSSPNSITIYMPTLKGSLDTKKNSLLFKNLLNETKEKLESIGWKPREIEGKLKTFFDLISDNHFWRDVKDGLALFHGDSKTYIYKVPMKFKEKVIITDGFHLKPIIPLLYKNKDFYLLSISKNSVKFYEGTRFSIEEIEVSGIPRSYDEAFPNEERERQLNFHTGAAPQGQAGRAGVFHGQGAGGDDAVEKKRLLEYCRLVDDGIAKKLADKNEPLILLAHEPLLGIYSEANSCPNLKYRINHNAENLRAEEIHKKAMETLGDFFEQDVKLATANYKKLIGTGKASNDLAKIVRAAHYDQIQDLFIDKDQQLWGRFDPETGKIELHDAHQPGDKDLLNLATVKTWISGGSVFVVNNSSMPDKTPAAATFRFPATH